MNHHKINYFFLRILFIGSVVSFVRLSVVFADTPTPTPIPRVTGGTITVGAALNAGLNSITGLNFIDGSNAAFFLDPSANPSLVVDGNVGIGTTTPDAKLDVDGYIRSRNSTSGPTTGKGLDLFYHPATDLGYIQSMQYDGGNQYKDLLIRGLNVAIQGNGSYGIYIKSGGNVGIGTTNPTRTLSIGGGGLKLDNNQSIYWRKADNSDDTVVISYSAANNLQITSLASVQITGGEYGEFQFSNGSPATRRMTIKSDGNVGIGTTAPGNMLDVTGHIYSGVNDATSGYLVLAGSGTHEGGQIDIELAADYDTTINSWSIDTYDDDLRFFTSNAAVVNIMTAEGQLTLPTSGSGAGLLLGGDAQLYRYAANVLRTPDTMIVDGNVGIGTTTPTATLDVVGHIAESSTSAPSVGTCGTSPSITGNDTHGIVTTGSTSVTACTVTFASAFTTAPYCVVSAYASDAVARTFVTSSSTTNFVTGFSGGVTSKRYIYHCIQ